MNKNDKVYWSSCGGTYYGKVKFTHKEWVFVVSDQTKETLCFRLDDKNLRRV